LYGLNSYTLSAGLLVESNVAEHNGRHGIILEHVTGGDVRNNISLEQQPQWVMLDAMPRISNVIQKAIPWKVTAGTGGLGLW